MAGVLHSKKYDNEARQILAIALPDERPVPRKMPEALKKWIHEQIDNYHEYIEDLGTQDKWSRENMDDHHENFDYFWDGLFEILENEFETPEAATRKFGLTEHIDDVVAEHEEQIRLMFDNSTWTETPTGEDLREWFEGGKGE